MNSETVRTIIGQKLYDPTYKCKVLLKNRKSISGKNIDIIGDFLIFGSTFNEDAETRTLIDLNEVSAIIGV